jgi:hypothetical protein
MSSAISLLYQEQMAQVLQEYPEPSDLPSLAEDLALMLRGVTDHAVSTDALRRFLSSAATALMQSPAQFLIPFIW